MTRRMLDVAILTMTCFASTAVAAQEPAILLPVDGACGAITGATDEAVEYVERFCVLSFHRWPDPAARVPFDLCELTAEYVAAAHAEGPALTLTLTADAVRCEKAAEATRIAAPPIRPPVQTAVRARRHLFPVPPPQCILEPVALFRQRFDVDP